MRCLTVLLAASTASALQPQAFKTQWRALGKAVAPALLGVGCLSSIAAPPANAADKRQIASITASGLVFKDKLIVDAFADPKVEGVTLYVSDFERPVVERVQKDFFSDPSRGAAQMNHPHAIDATHLTTGRYPRRQSGLACSRRAAPLKVGNVDTSPEGEDVVSEAKSLLFKTLRVKRIVDKEANALVYVSYSTRINKDDDSNKARFASSLCTVSMD